MLKRYQKNLFYIFASPFMRLNSLRIKFTNTFHNNRLLKLHLGPGREKYIENWINIDANMFTGKCDLWLDLRFKLPFKDSCVDYCYSHHMIEHLPNLKKHFNDIFRILKPGGVYRFGGPNGDSAIKKFYENSHEWFDSWPDNRKSIGGRFENFIFCRNEHLTILTFSHLEEILEEIGYKNIKKYLPTKETGNPDIFNQCLRFEHEEDFENPKTLIIEAIKP